MFNSDHAAPRPQPYNPKTARRWMRVAVQDGEGEYLGAGCEVKLCALAADYAAGTGLEPDPDHDVWAAASDVAAAHADRCLLAERCTCRRDS